MKKFNEFQGQKRWKHDFEMTGDPNGPPSGSTFWVGFEAPDIDLCGQPFLGSVKNFSPIGQKMAAL